MTGSPRPDPPLPAADLGPVESSPSAADFAAASAWWEAGSTRTFALNETGADAGPHLGGGGVAEAVRPDPAVEAPPPADPASRYVIGAVIGRGGMGVVHEGWDAQLKRETAVKVLLSEHKGKPEVVRRFLEEARITGRLQHPGVVAIHEVGWSPDARPYFVMRLVRGQTLGQLLQRRADPSADLTPLLTTFLQVCQAVAYAHSHGVIHRDLKPSNVMVGAFWVVKVMDWGLAKVLGEAEPFGAAPAGRPVADLAGAGGDDAAPTKTLVGTVFGTPAYLSPEQARGEIDRVDRRADVFGLGSILCEILTGLPPYTGADGREVYDKAAAAATGDALGRLNACAAPLDPVTLAKWCLAADPLDRPADASAVVEVLTAHLQRDQRRAEQDLVRFFDLSLDLFCIADMNGYFVRVNGNFGRVLGYRAAELTCRPFLDFVHPDDRARTEAQSAQLAHGEPCVQFLNRYRHAEGHYLWFEWSAQAVPEERATYAVARDVTERVRQAEAHRHAEQSTLHLAAAVDAAGVAVYSTALDGTVRSWSLAAERLFGHRADEVLGRPAGALSPPGNEGDESEVLERLRHGERVEHAEAAGLHKDGSVVPVSVTASAVKDCDGAVVGVSRAVRDLGDRKRSEAEAARHSGTAAFLAATNAALTRGVGPRESLRAVAELLAGHLGVASAQVWTLDEAAGVLELQAGAGPADPPGGPDTRLTVGRGEVGRVAQERKPHLTNALGDDPGWAVGEGMAAFAGHPLEVHGRVVGVVAVSARQPLTPDALDVLQSVSDILALAVRTRQVEAELRQLRATRPNP